MPRLFLLLLFLTLAFTQNIAFGQHDGMHSPDSISIQEVVINSIDIIGNKRTKEKIILRELDLAIGDYLPLEGLSKRLQNNQEFVMNTSLFNSCKINIKSWEENDVASRIDLLIEVTEAWYLYPIPIFELADRNFNVWWTEQRREFNRVNIGVRFIHTNLTGNDDRLKFVLHTGFTRKIEIQYISPFLNNRKSLRLLTDLFYATNKEISYATIGDKQQFFRSDNSALMKRRRIGFGLQYRPKIRTRHRFKATYMNNSVDQLVVDSLNYNFLLDGRGRQQFIDFKYDLSIDHRDIAPYPLNGSYFKLSMNKQGLGIFNDHSFSAISLSYARYHSFSERWSIGNKTAGRLALEGHQPAFYTYRALGYGADFLKGYELYVIDGTHYMYNQTSLRFGILNSNISLGNSMPLSAFQELPLKMYLTLHSDIGYVRDPYYAELNRLSNRLLVGLGVGLDFVIYFDKVIKLQFSRNHLNEYGVFLHFNLSI